MKIIDLAEKQRNTEILPKHIKYQNEDLYFDGVSYFDEEGNNDLLDLLAMENSALTHLFDEVEVIEDKKIKTIDPIDYCHSTDTSKDMVLVEKINEIIDKLNSMEE